MRFNIFTVITVNKYIGYILTNTKDTDSRLIFQDVSLFVCV